jgi:hypothetical protein
VSEAKRLTREEWGQLTSEEEIREQIAVRTEIQGMMVGQLYPSILEDEIWDLLDLIKGLP